MPPLDVGAGELPEIPGDCIQGKPPLTLGGGSMNTGCMTTIEGAIGIPIGMPAPIASGIPNGLGTI